MELSVLSRAGSICSIKIRHRLTVLQLRTIEDGMNPWVDRLIMTDEKIDQMPPIPEMMDQIICDGEEIPLSPEMQEEIRSEAAKLRSLQLKIKERVDKMFEIKTWLGRLRRQVRETLALKAQK